MLSKDSQVLELVLQPTAIDFPADSKVGMTSISSEIERMTSIRSLDSTLFIKYELPCRVLRAPGVILKFIPLEVFKMK